MFGHLLLVVAATIIGFTLYANIEASRKKDYFEAHDVSKEDRVELEKEEFRNKAILLIRLLIWLACVVSALFGEVLGIVLSIVFTTEAVFHIYAESYGAVRSRVSSLTMLAIPFGAFVAVVGMKAGIILGILLGVLTVFLVQICAFIGKQMREEE